MSEVGNHTPASQAERIRFVRHARSLERALSSPEAFARAQRAELNRVLAAAAQVEPYRSLWGATPEPMSDLKELPRFPLVDRAQMDAFSLDERTVPGQVVVVTAATSGTTGPFFLTGRSGDEQLYLRARLLRQWRILGRELDAPVLTYALGGGRAAPLVRTGRSARMGAQAPVEDQVAALELIRPTYLRGPPSTLLEMADRFGSFPVSGMETFGEVLDPLARDELRAAFGIDPLDCYGGSEAGRVSWQCPTQGSYHIDADTVLVEIVDEKGRPVAPGVDGEVVVTALWNVTTPIVRYRTGDMAALANGPCGCDIPLPVMSQVEGRRDDFFRSHDGSRVAPWRIWRLLYDPPILHLMKRCRFVQRSVDDLLVEVVWREAPAEDRLLSLEGSLRRLLSGPVAVEVRSVEELTMRPGSRRLIQSLAWSESPP